MINWISLCSEISCHSYDQQWGSVRVNPNYLSYPFPLALPLSFARSRESKGCPNSRFDRGVGLRGRGRFPLKPRLFASLLETEGYPEHSTQQNTQNCYFSTLTLHCWFAQQSRISLTRENITNTHAIDIHWWRSSQLATMYDDVTVTKWYPLDKSAYHSVSRDKG